MTFSEKNTAITCLGFDYGLRKIGVAVGQSLTMTATPIGLVKVQNKIPDWPTIEQLIHQWSPNIFIVGYPYDIDGSAQKVTKFALRFGDNLHARYQLPVVYVDERFTTIEAKAQLFADGGYDALIGGVDAYSAKLIVEQWFHEQQQAN